MKVEQQGNRMNKLDLVFEMEPPEVQKKLMGLLIQYNAVMQYNRENDKFQVDLLLPFRNQSQKKDFINQFKHRTARKRSESSRHQETIQNISDIQQRVTESEFYQDQKNEEVLVLDQSSHQEVLELSEEAVEEKDEESSLLSRNLFSLDRLEESLKQNLQKAIQEIRLNRFEEESEKKQKNHYLIEEEKSLSSSNEPEISEKQERSLKNEEKEKNEEIYIQEKPKENKIQMQQESKKEQTQQKEQKVQQKEQQVQGAKQTESQILKDQLSTTERKGQSKEVIEENIQPHSSMNSSAEVSRFSSTKNQILIEDENELHQQEEDFHDYPNDSTKHNNSASYHSFQYPQIIEEKLEEDEEQLFGERKEEKKQESKKKKNTESEAQKQKLKEKYRKKKPVPTSLRYKYSEFLKKNHKDIERLYDNIRKDIVKRNKQVSKSPAKKDAILILQENVTESDGKEEKAFKEEVMKEYQRNIMADNSHLSSEDLVRYFRYLLQHARSLYVRNLRKTNV